MRRYLRIISIALALVFTAATFTSCSVFERGGIPKNTKQFKHKKPLPKKYILPETSSRNIK